VRSFLVIVAALHAFFLIAELFPWSCPTALRLATKKLPAGELFTTAQEKLVAGVIHNAGIYNGIVAGGMLFSALNWPSAVDVAIVMLVGATVAGVFGLATLKSPLAAVQAVFGVIGLVLIFKLRTV
jgi:putative membrane protein